MKISGPGHSRKLSAAISWITLIIWRGPTEIIILMCRRIGTPDLKMDDLTDLFVHVVRRIGHWQCPPALPYNTATFDLLSRSFGHEEMDYGQIKSHSFPS